MVAKINSACKLHKIFNYNENKVEEKVASCIAASGYPKDLEDLSLSNKLNLLLNQAALRRGMQKPGVHISLSFHPSENHSPEKLALIAADYMEGIGFKDQPYLVYEHKDTANQHLHIVTLKVKSDGEYLRTNRIAANKSEPTRLRLEEKYGLVPAQESEMKGKYKTEAIDIQAIKSGKKNVRREITRVLNAVLDTYRFTSLPELNALLQLHNVIADRGGETSRTYKHGGLLYQITDEHGAKVSKPIKASSFEAKATLADLNKRFIQNKIGPEKDKRYLRVAIDNALFSRKTNSIESFCSMMREKNIDVVLRKNAEGRVYGITFVDHANQSVFNGRPLGRNYTATAIIQRCGYNAGTNAIAIHKANTPFNPNHTPMPPVNSFSESTFSDSCFNDANFLDALLQPEYTAEQLPYHLRLNRKKKRRKRKGPGGII